jgi:hypothetical protein
MKTKANREAKFVIRLKPSILWNRFKWPVGFERYNNNPIVCFQHKANSDNPDMILGHRPFVLRRQQMIAVVRFERKRSIHWQKRFGKSQAGTLRMASIGATKRRPLG